MWLGLDFSGNDKMWSPGCTRSNVWLAAIDDTSVLSLRRVQDLPGDEHPFPRLARFLKEADFTACGIDAPFALPAAHMLRGHAGLLKAVAKLPREGRPFAAGAILLAWAKERAALASAKPMRDTERHWRARGLNVRSTLWNGPRGGAAFTTACLTLLHAAGRPCYPWSDAAQGVMLETFPMAQLKTWGLPYVGYDGATGAAVRKTIVSGLAARLQLPAAARAHALASADALDAIVCALSARAWSRGHGLSYGRPHRQEGWIVVGA